MAHRRPGARPRDADERGGHRGSYGVGTICAVPGRLVAPGPGRSATVFTVPLAVAGMQKTDACTAPGGGMPSDRKSDVSGKGVDLGGRRIIKKEHVWTVRES